MPRNLWGEMPGDNRRLSRGVAAPAGSLPNHSVVPATARPPERPPSCSRPNIRYKSVPTVLTPTFLQQIISSLASPFCLTSGKTMNHGDKLLTSEIPSRNIVTNRNSAITPFTALDAVSASSINQSVPGTVSLRNPFVLSSRAVTRFACGETLLILI